MRFGTRPDPRPAGAVVPFLPNTPEQVRRIDRVLRVLPDDLLDTVKQHYITREHGRSARSHYQRLDRLHYAAQGALLMLDA